MAGIRGKRLSAGSKYKETVRQNKTDSFISEYARKHGIKILIDPKLCKNDGLCYPPYKEIHLAPTYSSQKIKLAVFCHEVSHIFVDRLKDRPFNSFECEFFAWQKAIRLHKQHFGTSFSKAQAEFMLKCLRTYCRSEYEFKKQSYKK